MVFLSGTMFALSTMGLQLRINALVVKPPSPFLLITERVKLLICNPYLEKQANTYHCRYLIEGDMFHHLLAEISLIHWGGIVKRPKALAHMLWSP